MRVVEILLSNLVPSRIPVYAVIRLWVELLPAREKDKAAAVRRQHKTAVVREIHTAAAAWQRHTGDVVKPSRQKRFRRLLLGKAPA